MTLTWVVGGSGLVGQAVCRRLAREGQQTYRHAVDWTGGAADQGAALREGLAEVVARAGTRRWRLAWVAGAGVVGTPPEVLDVEAAVLSAFLDDLATLDAAQRPEAVFLASSAGGVYAGGAEPPFTEDSPVAPLAPYGHQKVAAEGALTRFVARTRTPAMIGRLTNVYGPGQNLAKAQGLVSQLAKSSLLKKPISLYVSLDTTRDYVFVDDCARVVTAALDELASGGPRDEPVVKIVGSGIPVTIAALLGEFTRVLRRRPLVVLADSPNRRFQVRDLRMRSERWTHLDHLTTTPLPAGIGATVADLARRLGAGELQHDSRR